VRILLIREGGGLGDAVTIQASVAGLAERYPGAEIDWILPSTFHPLFRRDPSVTRLLGAERFGKREFSEHRTWDLRRYGFRNSDYDLVVDQWCPCWRHEHDLRWDARKSRIENFCEEAGVEPRAPRLYLGEAERQWARKALEALPHPVVLVSWHTANPAKDYPVESWTAAARRLAAAGAGIVFVGRRLFPERIGGALNLMNPRLLHLAALSEAADLVIGCDSGVAHVASALSTPTLWLFGPTNPISTLRFYPRAEWLWRPECLDCRPPCYYSGERGFRCRGRAGDCMLAIPPEAVAAAAERMIDWEAADEANSARGDALYRHFLTLNGVGVDYRAYGAWQTAYAEFIDHVLGIKGKRLLDVGSACGALVKGFLARGADALGVEPDPWMASHPVEGLDPARLLNAPMEAAPVEPETFDLAHSSQVLEHVPEEKVDAHLAAIFRALKPGGLFFAALALDTTPGAETDKTHVTLRPYDWWRERIAASGFEDATSGFRKAVEAEPMQREYGWTWFIWRKPNG